MFIEIKKNTFFLISIGAIPGALVRLIIDDIFLVNIFGSFLLGLVNSSAISKRYKLVFGVGLSGSMTTFSGWSFHLHNLISQGLYKLFLLNLILSVLIGIFAIGLGHIFGKKLNA